MDKKAAGVTRRSIPDDFSYNPKKVKHLKRVLHNVSVALGTLTSALNEFSRMKGPEVSPDGMLGGVGYIIPIREIKQTLNATVHGLSNIADCIADELTNPKWQVKEDKDVQELIKEKEDVVEKAEDVQEDIAPEDVVTVEQPAVEPVGQPATVEMPKEASDKVSKIVTAAVRRNLKNLAKQ